MPSSAAQERADSGEGGLLVLGLDVRLLGEAAGLHSRRLDRSENVGTLPVGPEGDLPGLAAETLVEHLGFADDHSRSVLEETGHEGRHVDLDAGRVDPHDAIAEILAVPHNQLVVVEDLLVFGDPAADHLIRLRALREMPGEVDPPRVVSDPALDCLVHDTTEVGREVHTVARIGCLAELSCVTIQQKRVALADDVVIDLIICRHELPQERPGGLDVPLLLRHRLDGQVVEGEPRGGERRPPVLGIVLVEHADDLVAGRGNAPQQVDRHRRLAVVDRKVDEEDVAALVPRRRIDAVDRERLRELDRRAVRGVPQNGGGGADAVHRTDAEDEVDVRDNVLHDKTSCCHVYSYRMAGAVRAHEAGGYASPPISCTAQNTEYEFREEYSSFQTTNYTSQSGIRRRSRTTPTVFSFFRFTHGNLKPLTEAVHLLDFGYFCSYTIQNISKGLAPCSQHGSPHVSTTARYPIL